MVRRVPAQGLVLAWLLLLADVAIAEDYFCNKTAVFKERGDFALGCLPSGNKLFSLGVAIKGDAGTRAWEANLSRLVSGDAVLRLDGDLRLLESDGTEVWRADVSGAVRLDFHDMHNGNVCLFNSSNSVLWQSFDHPRDLVLPDQLLRQGMQLLAPSGGAAAVAYYSAVMEPAGLAFFVNLSDSRSLPYDVFGYSASSLDDVLRGECNESQLSLSSDGRQVVLESGLRLSGCRAAVNLSTRADFLRLDRDGNLRGYAAAEGGSGRRQNVPWETAFEWFNGSRPCALPEVCGPYGVCRAGGCGCPGAVFRARNASDGREGCEAEHALGEACDGAMRSAQYMMAEVEGTGYFASSLASSGRQRVGSKQKCSSLCAENCSCKAAFYSKAAENDQWCFFSDGEVLSMIGGLDSTRHVTFLKAQNGTSSPSPFPSSASLKFGGEDDGRPRQRGLLAGLIAAGAVLCCAACAILLCCFRRVKPSTDGERLLGESAAYTFRQLQVATRDFSSKLGVGGFGSVYMGTLESGRPVAVKQLENCKLSYKDFHRQAQFLGALSAHHPNLASLVGFCADGAHRLLVYEYVSNGSLDAWIFHRRNLLDWGKRFGLAVDVARAVAFLHEGWRGEALVHLDIKPQNILLDEGFGARVSDYGLCRLHDAQEGGRATTHMRGTPNYMAPEWLLHTCGTAKSDVYSLGVVLLELVCGRKSVDLSLKQRESWYLPALAAHMYREGRVMELVDHRVVPGLDREQATRILLVALWCIQEEPRQRPSMSKVVCMLEGSERIDDPPLQAPTTSQYHYNEINIEPANNRHYYANDPILIGPSSPDPTTSFNVSFGSDSASLAYTSNAWSDAGGLQLDDCSSLLSSRD